MEYLARLGEVPDTYEADEAYMNREFAPAMTEDVRRHARCKLAITVQLNRLISIRNLSEPSEVLLVSPLV